METKAMSIVRATVICGCLWGSLPLVLGSFPVTDPAPAAAAEATPAEMTCTPCHTCVAPVRENPCLGPCLRMKPTARAVAAVRASGAQAGPDQIMLNQLEDLYLPVPFDHRGHAVMAEMSSGCRVCHHHTPEGAEHPACRSCHLESEAAEDRSMPGLKGAYHRQCLGCHREWSHDTACNVCHEPKAERGVPTRPGEQPTTREVVGRMNPPVEGRDTYVYATSHTPAPVVTFHHNDHVDTFGISCVNCHRGASCGQCHDDTPQRAARAAAPHGRTTCLSCHQEQNCSFCHDDAERPRFDHAGWPLGSHHADVPCSACHGAATEFTVPSKTCYTCHVRRAGEGVDAGAAQPVAGREFRDADCLACHAELKAQFAQAVCVHGPAADGSGCTACHLQAHVDSSRPPRERQSELCLGCHNRSIEARDGRTLPDLASELLKHPNHHGPVREGNCCACHQPHVSDHARLLTGAFAPGFYVEFDLKQYALCFRCHNEDAVMKKSGTVLTGFRAGDLNLHWLHVNRDKGRTCRACHEVHASSRPFHIRESVPYGDSGWMLPINYAQTASGGSCAPGCHAAKSYERGALTPALPASGAARQGVARQQAAGSGGLE